MHVDKIYKVQARACGGALWLFGNGGCRQSGSAGAARGGGEGPHTPVAPVMVAHGKRRSPTYPSSASHGRTLQTQVPQGHVPQPRGPARSRTYREA